MELFEREAKILQQLHHPRIPAYIDYFSVETSSETKFVLIQDFVEGKTLQQRVKEGWRGTEAEILDVFMQLLEICTYLHTHQPQVIHRDINPKNIILSPTDEVYLVDFGTGREIIRTTVYGGSTIVGTFGYIPFEQFSGQASPASDYYALGGTLLYMLTHCHPSDFPAEGLKLTLPSSLQTSPNIHRLLERLLEPDVKKRAASPEEVRRILEEKIEQFPEPQKAPYKTLIKHIKKIVKDDKQIRFEIPVGFSDLSKGNLSEAKFKSYGLEGFIPILLIPLGIISAVLFGSLSLFFIFFGGGLLSPIITPYIIWPRFGRHVIEMTPTEVQMNEECRGKKVHSLGIPIVAVVSSVRLLTTRSTADEPAPMAFQFTVNTWRAVPGPVPIVSNPAITICPGLFKLTAAINPSGPASTPWAPAGPSCASSRIPGGLWRPWPRSAAPTSCSWYPSPWPFSTR